jgi:hypothetical protein
MPRPKDIPVVTVAPAHSAAAIDEVKTGIEAFIEWANRARTGQTSLPAAVQADRLLTVFSQWSFHKHGHARVKVSGFALWFGVAGQHILNHVRDGHWHLSRCPCCDRWLLAKDQRRRLCRRVGCVRAMKRQKRAAQRQAQRVLDHGRIVAARR